MENKIDTKTVLNYSEGKYSWNDYLKVKEWFGNSRDCMKIEGALFEQWKAELGAEHPEHESFHHLFEKVHYQILLDEKRNAKKRNLRVMYRQVAAFLLIPVLAFSASTYFFYNQSQPFAESWAKIDAPLGSRVEFKLPDGSTGWLNSGSTLKYPLIFGSQKKVELTGEGYFDIRHQENSKFTISVPDMDIHVLGTKFNVSAYPDDEFTEVVLEEGKVEVSGKTAIFNSTLFPDKKITYNRTTNSLQKKEVETSLYSGWKEGFLILDNEPIGLAVGKLERWYNAEITIQDEELKKFRFKATFRDEPLEEVIHLLALTTPITYTIEKRDTDKTGVFVRKKVLIRLRK